MGRSCAAHDWGCVVCSLVHYWHHVPRLQLSRYCFMHIRDLRRMRPMLDFKTASIIATSIVHSKLDYCNSLYFSTSTPPKYSICSLSKIHSHGLLPEHLGIISLLSLNHVTG